MFSPNQYALLDFGDGRKLERFGEVLLDRPSPAAANTNRVDSKLWESATVRFVAANGTGGSVGQRGHWVSRIPPPDRWTLEHPPLLLELRLTEFGHVGVFPEQADNWSWIAEQIARVRTRSPMAGQPQEKRPRVLNLFAYTGASTLVAAAAGAEVAHIDASRSTIAWARRNAEHCGLAEAPIRWLVEDAGRFVAREARRGNRYEGIILDPPSYGHGPKGDTWQIERDLPDLLANCEKLLADQPTFLLLACHSSGVLPRDLEQHLLKALPQAQPRDIDCIDLFLRAGDGRRLHSGVSAGWTTP